LKSRRKFLSLITMGAGSALFSGCIRIARGVAPRYSNSSAQKGYTEVGKASYYGKKWHGRRTASGERLNIYALTAAHKTLPFNTRVKVTRLDNYKSVIVRINDRGPFAPGRIIDLTDAAAERIGLLNDGVATVKVEVLA